MGHFGKLEKQGHLEEEGEEEEEEGAVLLSVFFRTVSFYRSAGVSDGTSVWTLTQAPPPPAESGVLNEPKVENKK